MERSNVRIPPNQMAAERSLLAAVLVNPKVALADTSDLPIEAFYNASHAALWQGMVKLHNEGVEIDPVTLQNAVQNVGGESVTETISKLLLDGSGMPSIAVDYADMIKQAYARRQMIGVAHRLMSEAHDESLDHIEIQANAMRELGDINAGGRTMCHIKPLLKTAMQVIEAEITNTRAYAGLDTGFSNLSDTTGGLISRDYWVLAARPSVGKTTLATNIAVNLARKDHPVAIFSLEQSGMALAKRMIAAEAGINLRALPRVGPNDLSRLANAPVSLGRLPIFVDDFGGHTVATIRAEARRLKARYDIKAAFIDYMQIIRPHNRKHNRYEHLTETSGELKRMAKELEITVVALSQLSRNSSQEKRRPRLDDLRESGAIEQDADVAILLSPEPEEDELATSLKARFSDEQRKQLVMVDVAKNREGNTGPVFLRFNKELTRYESIALREE